MNKTAIALFALLVLPGAAFAEEEKEDCTTKPQSEWMTRDAIKAKVEEAGYHDLRSVEVKGSCYEIYAFDAANKRAEIYVDPVTAAIFKSEDD